MYMYGVFFWKTFLLYLFNVKIHYKEFSLNKNVPYDD